MYGSFNLVVRNAQRVVRLQQLLSENKHVKRSIN